MVRAFCVCHITRSVAINAVKNQATIVPKRNLHKGRTNATSVERPGWFWGCKRFLDMQLPFVMQLTKDFTCCAKSVHYRQRGGRGLCNKLVSQLFGSFSPQRNAWSCSNLFRYIPHSIFSCEESPLSLPRTNPCPIKAWCGEKDRSPAFSSHMPKRRWARRS